MSGAPDRALVPAAPSPHSPPSNAERKRKLQFATPAKAHDTTHAWVSMAGRAVTFFVQLSGPDVGLMVALLAALTAVSLRGQALEGKKSKLEDNPEKKTVTVLTGSDKMTAKYMEAALSVLNCCPIKSEDLIFFKRNKGGGPFLSYTKHPASICFFGDAYYLHNFFKSEFGAIENEDRARSNTRRTATHRAPPLTCRPSRARALRSRTSSTR